jgi:hypothetical protein
MVTGCPSGEYHHVVARVDLHCFKAGCDQFEASTWYAVVIVEVSGGFNVTRSNVTISSWKCQDLPWPKIILLVSGKARGHRQQQQAS